MWHPDKHKGDSDITAKFQEINEAYKGILPVHSTWALGLYNPSYAPKNKNSDLTMNNYEPLSNFTNIDLLVLLFFQF